MDYSAAICVNAELADCVFMLCHSSDNEIDGIMRHLLNALLDNVVSILVIDTVEHCILKLLDQELLLVNRYEFECLLDNSASIHRLCQLKHGTKQLIG